VCVCVCACMRACVRACAVEIELCIFCHFCLDELQESKRLNASLREEMESAFQEIQNI